MIDCKMGISADTLVLVHSSTKVSNETYTQILKRFSVVHKANLGRTQLVCLLCSLLALNRIHLAILVFVMQAVFVLLPTGSHI